MMHFNLNVNSQNSNTQFLLNKLNANGIYYNPVLFSRLDTRIGLNNGQKSFLSSSSINVKNNLQSNNQKNPLSLINQKCNTSDQYINQRANINDVISNINDSNNLNTFSNSNLIKGNMPTQPSTLISTNSLPFSQTTCSLNNTLFVGNLHASLQEIDLIQVFRPFGRIVECCKKWLHFGFVKFTSEEEACHAYVTLNGFRLKGRPMRLEFQNRTKKARIKAILAQAALQVTSTFNNESIESISNSNLFVEDYQSNINSNSEFKEDSINFLSKKIELNKIANTCNLLNHDQLIKFANNFGANDSKPFVSNSNYNDTSNKHNIKEKEYLELNKDLMSSDNYICKQVNSIFDLNATTVKNYTSEDIFNDFVKKTGSPSDSPQHDISSSLSSSSDSGCRSTSFLIDEDSGISSLKSLVSFKNADNDTKTEMSRSTDIINNFSENKVDKLKCIDDYSKTYKLNKVNLYETINDEKDCITDHESNTSDDVSEFPTDSECQNELEIIEDNFSIENLDCLIVKNYNQIIEKDGTVVRKKLDYGIYRSINQTMSLFIEPHDILKEMSMDEYEEYNLFSEKYNYMTNVFLNGK